MKLLRTAFLVLALPTIAAFSTGCASKPTMKVNHAEIQGVQLGFPPSLSLQMTVVLDVHNPNSYDVAIRAVRGQVTFFDQYSLPVNFNPGGDGVWLPANQTTQVRVPTTVPLNIAMTLTHQALTGVVPFHAVGKTDVTATKTFKIESDDYSFDERGQIQRQVIDNSIAALGIPLLGIPAPMQAPPPH